MNSCFDFEGEWLLLTALSSSFAPPLINGCCLKQQPLLPGAGVPGVGGVPELAKAISAEDCGSSFSKEHGISV